MRHIRSTEGTINFPPGYDGLLDQAVYLPHGQVVLVPDEVADVLLDHPGVEDVTPEDVPEDPEGDNPQPPPTE